MADHVDQIEIVPIEDGTWERRKRIDGEVVETHECETRKQAIAEARAANGVKELNVTDQDGNIVGRMRTREDDSLRIVLLRLDESLHGELDPPPSTSTGQPHVVSLTPVSVSDTAQKLNQEG